MRTLDIIQHRYAHGDTLQKAYLLRQIGKAIGDFEAVQLKSFLLSATHQAQNPVVIQEARRALKQEQLRQVRELHLGASSAKSGTWSNHILNAKFKNCLERFKKAASKEAAGLSTVSLRSRAFTLIESAVSPILKIAKGQGSLANSAIEVLGSFPSSSCSDVVAQFLNETSKASSAIEALRRQQTERALALLLQYFHKEGAISAQALSAIAAFPTDEAQSVVLQNYAQCEPMTRISLASSITGPHTATGKRVIELLLKDDLATVRLIGADILAKHPCNELTPSLVELYETSSRDIVRESAVNALAIARGAEAEATLIRALADPAPFVRASAIEGMVRRGIDGEVIQDYLLDASRDPHPTVKANAILAMAVSDGAKAYERLVTLLRQPSLFARATGVFCLGYMQTDRSLEIMDFLLRQEPSMIIAVQATKALAKYTGERAVELRLSLLKSEHTIVRALAARQLATLPVERPESTCDELIEASNKERDEKVRAEICHAIGRLSKNVELMTSFLKDKPAIISSTIEAFEASDTVLFIGFIEGLIEHKCPSVRNRAAVLLWRMGETTVINKLAATLSGKDIREVATSLGAIEMVASTLDWLNNSLGFRLLTAELIDVKETTEYGRLSKDGAAVDSSFDFQTSFFEEMPDVDIQTSHSEKKLEVRIENVIGLALEQFVDEASTQACALVEDTHDIRTYLLSAQLFSEQERYSEAAEMLSQALLRKRMVVLLLRLAQARRNRGCTDEALELTAEAYEAASAELGQLAASLRRLLSIENGEELPIALNMHELDLSTLDRRLGLLLEHSGDDAEAYQRLMLSHILSPRDLDVSKALARVAVRTNQCEFAIVLLSRLLTASIEAGGLIEATSKREALVLLSRLPRTRDILNVFEQVKENDSDDDVRQHARACFEAASFFFSKNNEESADTDCRKSTELRIKAVEKLQGDMEISQLLTTVRKNDDPRLLTAVIDKVKSGTKVNWAMLQDYLAHNEPRVRVAAVEAIGKTKDALVWPILVPLLDDSNKTVRQKTMTVLKGQDERGLRDQLEQMGHSTALSRRRRAYEFITQIDERWTVELVLQIAEHEPSFELFSDYCGYIAEKGDEQAAAVLADLTDTVGPRRAPILRNVLKRLSTRLRLTHVRLNELRQGLREQRIQKREEKQKREEAARKRLEAPVVKGNELATREKVIIGALLLFIFVTGTMNLLRRSRMSAYSNSHASGVANTSKGFECRVLRIISEENSLVVSRKGKYYQVEFPKGMITKKLKPKMKVWIVGRDTGSRRGIMIVMEGTELSVLNQDN